MIKDVTSYLIDFLPKNITTIDTQSGWLADLRSGIDLRKSAVLLELRNMPISPKKVGWNSVEITGRLWIFVMITQSYQYALEEQMDIIGGSDTADGAKVSLYAALDKLKKDPTFSTMSGTFNGKDWRIFSGNPITYGNNTQFGTSTIGSQAVASATVEISINIEQRM